MPERVDESGTEDVDHLVSSLALSPACHQEALPCKHNAGNVIHIFLYLSRLIR